MTTSDAKRVVVLAEPEALFLPDCVARLARLHPLAAIIELPSPPLRLNLRRGWTAFGPAVLFAILASDVLAKVVDRLSPHRYYSLRKVARRLDIPYERVSGLHAADCLEAIDRHRPDVIFAQVSSRVRPELLARATFWNKHCALLPAYAGVFPVFWALRDRQEELGVTVHVMDEEFDQGPILAQATIPTDSHTFFSAYHALYDLVAPLLDRALRGQVDSARGPLPAASYYSFPRRADRVAFRSAGLRFGTPFRLQAPVIISPQSSGV
jgi:hypothetical protein